MKKLLILIACLCASRSVMAWGQKGHDVTAYIAECHLMPQAAANIDKVLQGHSLVYYANWLDNASHTPEYAYTKTWHYLNIDEGKTFETMPRNPQGDVVTAVESILEKIRKGGMTPEEERIQLIMLIHLIGDMHCPMHAGRLSDLGGNRRPVSFFGKESNLHSAWDSALLEAAHRWSYTEWQQQLDFLPIKEVTEIQAGSPEEWIKETQAICSEIYDKTPEGTKISYDYVAQAAPIIEKQLLRGGYRLARLLNDLYR